VIKIIDVRFNKFIGNEFEKKRMYLDIHENVHFELTLNMYPVDNSTTDLHIVFVWSLITG